MTALISRWPLVAAFLAASIGLSLFTANAYGENAPDGDRYGLLGLIDRRSQYGKGVFPEPFLNDDSDLEVNEIRLDWFHNEGKGTVGDELKLEFEKGFGPLTIEVAVGYERSTSKFFDLGLGQTTSEREEGLTSIELGARIPVWQYVSKDQFIDNTVGVGFELAIPTNTAVSKNTELVPKIFDDLCIGRHFTVQAIVGYSYLAGPGPDGGAQALEYGLDFGWKFYQKELGIRGVESIIPVFELSGETAMNGDDRGHNSLLGLAGFRLNLEPVGGVQPRLGFGYVFPIDGGARDDLDWGVVTSLVFEW